MGWPQYVVAALLFMGLGSSLVKHGEPKDGKHSFWISAVAAAIEVYLLHKGGFW